LVIACAILAAPTYSLGIEEAGSATVIEMERYAVQSKLSDEWDVNTHPEHQVVEFVHVEKKGWKTVRSRTMVIVERDTSRMYEGPHSERWIADSYRRAEESNMIAQGVMQGMYQLKDVAKSEMDIHEKHFYTMTYTQYFDSHIGHGYLFLHFPSAFQEKKIFYVFLFSEIKPLTDEIETDLSDFYSIIEGFHIKENNIE
jgi:hypothetical protein